jgi:puromycin-sensitive aminopeptidase
VDLHLELDPARGRAFKGEVALDLHLERRRRSVELHAAELRVSRARLETEQGTLRGTVEPHTERETIEVRFDRPIPTGDATLRLAFAGRLRSDLRGLYAASSDDRQYAFTQLEAADARRFFPCFDEPAMKARFRISVTTTTGNTVLSNSPVAKVEPLGGGRKRVHFERTPPLSTYLLALAVGELEASQPTRCGKTEIRVWHVPGKGALTAFALETARETLARLETYFDLAYPYEKLDLVAVPDFEAGAMENAGAVFFREALLLVDPETATPPGEETGGGGDLPRAGPHVVRRPGHDGLVERSLAERGLCDLDGLSHRGRLEAAMEDVARLPAPPVRRPRDGRARAHPSHLHRCT